MRRGLVIVLLALLAGSAWPQGVIYIPNNIGSRGTEGNLGPVGATGSTGASGAPGIDGADAEPLLFWRSPAAAETADLSAFVGAGFFKYRLEYQLTISGDDKELWLLLSSDGGVSFPVTSGAYGFVTRSADTSGGSTNAEALATQIELTAGSGSGLGIGNATGKLISGSIMIDNLGSDSLQPLLHWRSDWINANGNPTVADGSGTRNSLGALNSIRLQAEDSPTVTITGEVRLYGIRNAN